jgi:hypothetical protein
MVNLAEYIASFDPSYQLKLQQIQQSAYNEMYRAGANMERERFKASEEWQRMQYKSNQESQQMQYKAGEEWRQLQFKNDQENQRTQNILDREDQRETIRGQNALAVEKNKGQNAVNLSNYEHRNKLLQMQADLESRMIMAGFESGILATQKMIDEDNKRRASMLEGMETRGKLRGEVFKMLAGAVIQEKLAQKQHARDVEKLNLESKLRQDEQYFQKVCLHLAGLLEAGKKSEADRELERILGGWQANEIGF